MSPTRHRFHRRRFRSNEACIEASIDHRVVDWGKMQSADIGLSLGQAKSLVSAVQDEFVAAQAAEIVETHRQCHRYPKRLKIKDWKAFHKT